MIIGHQYDNVGISYCGIMREIISQHQPNRFVLLRNSYNKHTSIRDINVVGIQIHLRLLERDQTHKLTARLIQKHTVQSKLIQPKLLEKLRMNSMLSNISVVNFKVSEKSPDQFLNQGCSKWKTIYSSIVLYLIGTVKKLDK